MKLKFCKKMIVPIVLKSLFPRVSCRGDVIPHCKPFRVYILHLQNINPLAILKLRLQAPRTSQSSHDLLYLWKPQRQCNYGSRLFWKPRNGSFESIFAKQKHFLLGKLQFWLFKAPWQLSSRQNLLCAININNKANTYKSRAGQK